MACAPERLTSGGRSFRVPLSGPPSHAYVIFDYAVTGESAEADPMGFVADLPERVIMDEVQRVPGLFAALKLEVDRRRAAVRFLSSTRVRQVRPLRQV